jgi:MFS family permease
MVGVAFAAGFVVFGVVYSFGVFLKPVMADLGASSSAASAWYAISSVGFYFLGPFTGSVGDRYGPRAVTAAGAVAMSLGLVATAFIDSVWAGWITYGLGVGIGAACAHIPTFANVGGWFEGSRTKALGIAVAGTGCGMLVVPPLAAWLIEAFGWRWAIACLGAGSGIILGLSALLVRPAPGFSLAASGEPLGPTFRSASFLWMYASWVLATMALFVPLVFLPAFAIQNGADPVAASWLISILGGTSIGGRVGIGFVGTSIGVVARFKIAVLAMAASYLLWLALPGFLWLIVFAALLGLAYGVRIALVAPVVIELFGAKGLGALLGVFFTASGIAGLLGPLLASAIFDFTGSHAATIIAAVCMGFLGFLAIVPLKPDPGALAASSSQAGGKASPA